MAHANDKLSGDAVAAVKKFVADMNEIYAKKYKAENKGKDLKKGKDLYPKITFKMGKIAKVGFRSPEVQGQLLAQRKAGKTKVCWSAHMTGGARHVPTFINCRTAKRSDLKKALGAAGDAEFEKNWVDTMKKYNLLNADRKQAWYSKDGFHLELPGARPGKKSKMSRDCIRAYVIAAGEDPTRMSKPLETDSWAKTEIKKVREELNIRDLAKIAAEARAEELKKMSFRDKMKGHGKLFSKVKKSTKVNAKIKGNIQPPKKVLKEAGPSSKAPRFFDATQQVKAAGLTLNVVMLMEFETYENLSQIFVNSASFTCWLKKDADAPESIKATAIYKYEISLKKGATKPTGKVLINYRFDGPGRENDHHGQIVFEIDGLKSNIVKTG